MKLIRKAVVSGVCALLFSAVACGDDAAETGSDDTNNGTATNNANNGSTAQTGGPCASCDDDADCGEADDRCLVNRFTGEAFCGTACTENTDCPDRFVCAEIGQTGEQQCVHESGSCQPGGGGSNNGGLNNGGSNNGGATDSCDPSCADGKVCRSGVCVDAGDYDVEQAYCVQVLNNLRAIKNKPPLQRSAELEECATSAAIEDAETGTPHGHFQRTQGCNFTADAENEIPGWPLSSYGSVRNVVKEGADSMFAEGPGGGHYENIIGDHTDVGCGIHVTADNDVWVVHNFN